MASKWTKAIKETKIKTTVRYHFTPTRMVAIIKDETKWKLSSVDEDEEKLESFFTDDGNINWHSYCGKQYGDSSKN